MFASLLARWRLLLILGLMVLGLGFFVSTLWLFGQSFDQRRELARSIRASGWVSYQAQIEFVKFDSALEICEQAAVACDAAPIGLRAALLASRLNILSDSEEGNQIPTIADYRDRLRVKFDELAALSDDLQHGTLDSAEAKELRVAHEKLGAMLQQLLRDAVLYNSTIEARQALLRTEPTWAFLLLVATGLGLIGLLALELRQRTRLLRTVQELHQAEQLRQQEMVELFEALPLPVIVIGNDGRANFANLATERFLTEAGTTMPALLEGLPVSPGPNPATQAQEVPFVTAEGAVRFLSIALATALWRGAPATILVISDDTKTRDNELRALAAGKLAVLGELAAGIAHELNQPLAVIRAAAGNGVIISERMGEIPLREKFARIDAQVGRAGRIVQTILQLGHSTTTPEDRFSVLRAMNAAFGLVGHQYKLASIELQLDIALSSDVQAKGDATLLEIALLNILLNARDAFSDQKPVDQRRVLVSAWFDGQSVEITVSDNAGGISETVLQRIFTAFVTSKAPGKGTGLGLAMSRRAIAQMGGSIQATNKGQGAQFRITLPAEQSREHS